MKAPRIKGGWLAVSLVAVLVFALSLGQAFTLSTEATGLEQSSEVCPQGGEWSSHQSPPMTNEGADEYCGKGGSENSEGCTGYLVTGSFEEVQAVVNDEDSCALSHWSYKQSSDTPTPPPPTDTPTPDPTATPTEGPSATPTETPEVTNTPAPQPTDPPKEEPPTGPGDPGTLLAILWFALAGGSFAGAGYSLKRTFLG